MKSAWPLSKNWPVINQKYFWPILPAILLGLVYLYTKNQIFSFDSITNAIACESNELVRWFHPNHIFYPFLGALWFKLESFFGYTGTSLYSLARFNSLITIFGIGIFIHSFHPTLPRIQAVLIALVIGTTYAVWHYSTDGRAIGASTGLILIILSLTFKLRRSSILSTTNIILIVCLSTIYTFIHGIGFLHAFILTWYIWPKRDKKNNSIALLYLCSFLVVVLLSYLFIYFQFTHEGPRQSFFSWALGYAGFEGMEKVLESPYWSPSIPEFFYGLWEGWNHFFYFPSQSARFFERLFMYAIGLMAFCHFVVCLFLRTQNKKDNRYELFLFYWGLIMMVFIGFWSPGQEGFRIHALLPWIVLMGLRFKNYFYTSHIWALSATLLFTFNLIGPIGYKSSIKNNTGYQQLLSIQNKLKPGDAILTAYLDTISNSGVLIPYFFPQIEGGSLEGRLYANRENSLDGIKKRIGVVIKRKNGYFISSDLLRSKNQKMIEEKFNLETGEIARLLNQYSIQPAFEVNDNLRFYALAPRF